MPYKVGMPARTAKVPLFGNVARSATITIGATVGAQIGVDLLMPDGSIATTAKLVKLFGVTPGSSPGTTDDLDEGQWHLWFTDRRAEDAVGGILANSTTISFDYVAGNSISATLNDLADSGVGASLVKLTRDAKGRISGTSAATTSDLTEGANLYYTNARADARITLQKGAANGLAPLESDGKISTSYLPAAVLGQVSYQGTWDASAGTPPSVAPEKGWYFIVTVAGTTDLDGITSWNVGDWAIYDGASWEKVDNTDSIATWNGRTGAVVPEAGDYTFAMLDSPPDTLAGYGITDAATSTQGAKADTALQPDAAGQLDTTARRRKVTALGNITGAVTLDLASGDIITGTMTGDCAFSYSNLPPAGYIADVELQLVQDATGGRAATWPASGKWPGGVPFVPTTTAAALDVIALSVNDAGGWIGYPVEAIG